MRINTIEDAIILACQVHQGKVDEFGRPYIFHLLQTMLLCDNENERLAAVLQKVLEHSSLALQDLVDQGFNGELISTLDVLIKRSGEQKDKYNHPLSQNVLAESVAAKYQRVIGQNKQRGGDQASFEEAAYKGKFVLIRDEKTNKITHLKFNGAALTRRELECFYYLIRGKPYVQIAAILNLSARTVESYVDNMKLKLSCNSRDELVGLAFKLGIERLAIIEE